MNAGIYLRKAIFNEQLIQFARWILFGPWSWRKNSLAQASTNQVLKSCIWMDFLWENLKFFTIIKYEWFELAEWHQNKLLFLVRASTYLIPRRFLKVGLYKQGFILVSKWRIFSKRTFKVRRQNSTSAEEVIRFQCLFPNPSWLTSVRKPGHQKLVSIFPWKSQNGSVDSRWLSAVGKQPSDPCLHGCLTSHACLIKTFSFFCDTKLNGSRSSIRESFWQQMEKLFCSLKLTFQHQPVGLLYKTLNNNIVWNKFPAFCTNQFINSIEFVYLLLLLLLSNKLFKKLSQKLLAVRTHETNKKRCREQQSTECWSVNKYSSHQMLLWGSKMHQKL